MLHYIMFVLVSNLTEHLLTVGSTMGKHPSSCVSLFISITVTTLQLPHTQAVLTILIVLKIQ